MARSNTLDFRPATVDIAARPGSDLTWRVTVTDEGITVGTITCVVGGQTPTVDTTDSATGMLVCDITLTDTQTTALGATSVSWSLSNTVGGVTTCYVTGNYTGSTAGNSSNGLRAGVIATSGRADVDVLVSTSAATAIAAHLIDPTGAHAATAVSFAGTGGLDASTVEAAFGTVPRKGVTGHLPVLDRIRRAKGGVVGTNGKGVIAFRVDHGLDEFLATFWPLMRDRGLPAGIGIVTGVVGDPADAYEPTSSTWANVLTMNWEGVEVWSHSHTHLEPAPAGPGGTLTQEINTSRSLIEAEGMMVMGWHTPGVPGNTTPDYSSLFDSADSFNSEIGQRILETYGLVEAPICGVHRKLPTAGCYGQTPFTMDLVSVAAVQAQIGITVRYGWGLELMFHPRNIGDPGYMSTADLTTVFDYVKTLWDAGTIEVLTPSGLAFADPGRSDRFDLFTQPSFEGITRVGTVMGDWSLSSDSVAITLATDGGHTGSNYVHFDPTTAYVGQGNAHVVTTGASGGTFLAEGWARAPAGASVGRLIVLDNSGATAFTLTKTVSLGAGSAWTHVRMPFTVPPTCTTLAVRFGWTSGDDVDWDDVTVRAV